jgi:hypothetical protein
MEHTQIKAMIHQPTRPLSIERDWTSGREKIVIEGVAYDADYFRTFAYPDGNTLYAVRKEGDIVVLTSIRNVEDARKFFEEVEHAL